MSEPAITAPTATSPGLGVPLADAGLALAYGTTMVLGTAAVLTSPHVIGHTEHLETLVFVLSFGLFLPVSVLAARARSVGLEAHDHYALAVANLGAIALLLVIGRAAFNSGGSPALRKTVFVGASLIAAANVAAPRMLRRMSNFTTRSPAGGARHRSRSRRALALHPR